MSQEYKYGPPFKYLFIGLGGLLMSVIFGMTIFKSDVIWISIITGAFFLMTLTMGIGFLTIFFRKSNGGNLKLGADFIEIPRRWRSKIHLGFHEIVDIGEIDTYDNVIEIQSKNGVHLIERNWMKEKEFEIVKKKLQEYWKNK